MKEKGERDKKEENKEDGKGGIEEKESRAQKARTDHLRN